MDSSHNCQNQNSKDIWSAIRSLKNSLNPKLMANKENKTKSTPNMKSDGSLQINSLSFTYEVEQRDSNRGFAFDLIKLNFIK